MEQHLNPLDLLDILRKFPNLGVKPEDGFHEKRKVQISNYLMLLMFGVNLVPVFTFGVFHWQSFLFWDGFSTLIFILVFQTLHMLGFRSLVRHLVVLSSLFALGNLTYHFGEAPGVHFFVLPLTVVIFLLFDNMYVIVGYLTCVLVMFTLYEAVFRFDPPFQDPLARLVHYPNFFASILIFLFVLYNFRFESDRYQEIVEAQNKDLSALSFKMMIQKDEALIAGNLLKQKTTQLESQNKSILDSLRLASMLQQETLPSDVELFHGLKAGMVIYKPKDIVSGDFYWVKRTYEGLILVVADCIGHGVPGGMMAVFASNLISQIVEEQGKTFPSDILEELDRRLRRRIKQDIQSDLGDGMDIAVCLITETTLSFSAASRPLVLVNAEGATRIIPGTRFQLATWKTENQAYETVELEIQPGDRFYLFTDGTTDQLSGRDGKRLGTRNLVREISLLHDLPLSKQKTELETLLDSWQGNAPQTDDILLIGFEV